MSDELFEEQPKKKLSKQEQNKLKLKEMNTKIKKVEKKVNSKGIAKYEFKCAKCDIQVILEGDDPQFSKRTTCDNCK